MQNLIVSRNPARKTRSAAQRAASRRNIKKAQASRRRRRSPRRRRNVYLAAKRRTPRRRSNPGMRRSFANPRARFPTFQSIINNQVVPAMVGGAGAVVNDIIVNMLPLPAQFKTGWMRHVSKALGAVAIGMLGGFVLQKRTADQLGAGAMTVVGYNVVRDLTAQFAPQIPLGEYLGEYLPMGGLDYYGAGLNPGAIGTIPGSGMETAGQFTRGSPYMAPELDQWPTGSAYDDLQY